MRHRTPPAPGHLLVVDDNEMNRDMLSRRLARKGFDVTVAENGAEALQAITECDFDLVLLDIMMPGMDGLQVLESLRRDRTLLDLPVIMATARVNSDDVVRALKLGANDYVTKPLDFPVVLARVNTQLALRQATRQLEAAHARMKNDLEAAAEIQRSLLPQSPPDSSRIKFHWSFKPSDELAGDTLNVFSLGDHQLVLYMLDVSGHGVSAALLSVTLHRLLSPRPDGPSVVLADTDGTGRRPVPPAEVARQLNEQFPMRPERGQYFTLLYGLLNTETLEFRFVCAGHPPPIYIPENDDARILNVNGFPIGLLQEATYQDHVISLFKGDRLYFYSDGVTEAMDPQGEMFGQERWLDAVQQVRDKSLKDSLSVLSGSLETWCVGSSCDDDISILAVEVVE